MLTRIVKLSFKTAHVDTFQQIFDTSHSLIRDFEGCHSLELLQDISNPNIFFTYSQWQSEDHLNAYRNSEVFKNIWGQTKILFKDKPEAWSVVKLR